MALNKVMIIGNIGKDPEKRSIPSGMSVTSFSVAVNGREKGKDGEWADVTEWFSVVCFDRLADRASDWLKKGRKVYVEGRLKTRSWEDKNSGEKKYKTELIASSFDSIDRKPTDSETASEASSAPADAAGASSDDDVPF
jgi:single-strand DNA-binding protein